jgi:chromosome segregation ATPase
MSRHLTLLIAGLLGLCSPTRVVAADPNAAEVRLRDNLKNTMLQLRTAETERANLQAAQAENEQKIKTLTTQVEAQGKQLAADKDAADKGLAELKTKVDERDREIGELRVSLDKWKTGHTQVTELAKAKEAQRAKLASEVIVLIRKVADQQTKNAAMFQLGNEILTRYEKFGLGTALTAREPFVGLTRVKFENLIQDYGDKLADQKIKP